MFPPATLPHVLKQLIKVYSTAQRSAAQHSTAQHSTAQYSTQHHSQPRTAELNNLYNNVTCILQRIMA